ncbi:MAG: transposase [Elusimicrobiota bacterium]
MLQLKSKGPDLWDSIIPEEARALPEDLAYVDELLRDARFMAPFVSRFDAKTGRRGLPVATYLRLMYLRRKHRLGYEALVGEVSASIQWRSFCGIGCQDRVPSPSTLAGLTQKYGEETLIELYRLVSEDLREWKIQRRRKAFVGDASSGRRAQRNGLSRRLAKLLGIVRGTMDQARRLAARIKGLRLRRKAQMSLDLDGDERRDAFWRVQV